MLHPESIQTVADVVKFSTRLKAILFEWDSKRCRLIVTRSWKQRIYFIAIVIYLTAEAIYQGCTLCSESHVRTIPLESFMKLVAHFFIRLCGLFVTLVNAYNAKSISIFFNQMLQMNRRFRIYFHGEKSTKCPRLLRTWKYFLYIQPLVPACTYVLEYRDIRYWHGAVFPGFIMSLIWPCFFVIEYWISFFVMSGPTFWGCITYPHCFCTPAWMNVLRLKRKYVDVLAWHKHRIRNGSCILYKGLQILNQMYNCCYADAFGFGLAACMTCLVLMITLSIQLTPKVEFPGCLLFPVGVMGLLQVPRYGFAYTVKVTEASMTFIECYRLTRNPLQAKAVRSLMPLVVRVSGFCEISRSTMLAFYSNVISYTVSMLLIKF